ncbi:hypothetical protein AB0C76_10550 [Kitasatospora sp. NPDC048722]|uniref:hypothetical protein n=1 Tax=Kitasatospora sp. NPDC048722 TaxID=3155639 RepID=UPI0033C79F12
MNSFTSTSTRALAGLAVVGVLTLTACNDNSSSDTAKTAAPTAPTTAAPATTAAAPSATASAAAPTTPAAATEPATGGAPAAGTGKDAAPGTTAKIGDTVQVPFSSGSTKGSIAMTVTSIEQGTQADLDSLKLGDKAAGMVPYYIHYKFTNVGTTDLSNTTLTHIRGLQPDGSGAQGVAIFTSFPKCTASPMPPGFTNGQSAVGCFVSLAPAASKVAGAEYSADPYTIGKGVVWE